MQEYGKSGPSDQEIGSAVPQASGAHEVRVGIFVLLAIAAFVVVLFMMTDPAALRGRYKVSTVVDNALGIRRGDPVQMRGVNIGRVHRFGLRDDSVEIVLEVDGEWEIPADSRTRLTSAGLLGGMTVEVVPGQAAEPVPDGTLIPGSGGAPPLMETAGALAGDAQAVLGRINQALSEHTVVGIEESVTDLRNLLGTLSSMAATQSRQIDALTSSLQRSAASVEEATPDLQNTLARADSAMIGLNRVSAQMSDAAGSLDIILTRIERGEGSMGRLLNDDSLYVAVTRAAESIEALTSDLRENPGRYIKISVF